MHKLSLSCQSSYTETMARAPMGGKWGGRGCRVVRWCWVKFQGRGVLLSWVIVGQVPTVFAVGAGGGCLAIFFLSSIISLFFLPIWKTARYRLKNCLKGPLSPKQPNQPTIEHRCLGYHGYFELVLESREIVFHNC